MASARRRRRTGELGEPARLLRLELLLAGRERPFPQLDGLTLELDGAELAASPFELRLLGAQARSALGDVPVELLELRLALGEIGGAETQHPLDRCAHVAEKRLSALEVLERVLEASRLVLELAAPLGEEPLELLLGARGVREDAAGDVGLHRPQALLRAAGVGLGGASCFDS